MFHYKEYSYGEKNDRLLFFFTGWTSQIWLYKPVLMILTRSGFHCIVYEYKDILSSDVEETGKNFLELYQASVNKYNAIQKKYKSYGVLGISIGTIPALMLTNTIPKLNKLVLILSGASIAETVWSWDNVYKVVKEGLKLKGVTLEKLKNDWKLIEPEHNLDKISGKKVLLYTTVKDEIIPYEQSLKLREAFKKRNIDFAVIETKIKPHILAAAYFLLKAKTYIQFLKSE
jgi:esterase/lipase